MPNNREPGRAVSSLHVYLHIILVVSVVVVTTYLLVQLVSFFGPITRDTGMEVGVLKQEVNFLKTELSRIVFRQEIQVLKTEITNELFRLREEHQRDLSDLLQRVATGDGMGISYEALSNWDDTSLKVVKDATEVYDIIKTGQLDFASASLGGSIVSTRKTKAYRTSSPFGSWERSAQHIIQACVMPGECWAFEGEGAVVIQLIGKVNITAVSIEHPVHGLLQTDAIKSAPKDFSVWGLNSLVEGGHYLGNFSYDIDGSPLQYFTIQEASANPFDLIELKIHTNHGNPRYTCLYRFRVHGSMGHPAQANTLSNGR